MNKVILISPESELKHEVKVVIKILENHNDTIFHLRKPDYSKNEYFSYLKKIPQEFYSRIKIHQYHDFLEYFPSIGLHFTEQKRKALSSHYLQNKYISTGFHSIKELCEDRREYEYVFLSPIFNSISKEGYKSSFKKDKLLYEIKNINKKVIALGGVDLHNIGIIKQMNFSGIAVLGAVWSSNLPYEAFLAIKNKFIESNFS